METLVNSVYLQHCLVAVYKKIIWKVEAIRNPPTSTVKFTSFWKFLKVNVTASCMCDWFAFGLSHVCGRVCVCRDKLYLTLHYTRQHSYSHEYVYVTSL